MRSVRRVLRALRTRGKDRSDNGHVIALHEWKALYFAVPKVANSSLKSVCVDLLEIPMPSGAWKPSVFNTRKFDHLYDRRNVLISARDAESLPDYWKFAFVRDPWDRLVSCFEEKLKRDHPAARGVLTDAMHEKGIRLGAEASFPAFVRAAVEFSDDEADRHIRSQQWFLTDGTGELLVDYVGKFETLSEDFRVVSQRLGLDTQLPHLLKSQRRPYQDYYSEELRDLVARRYRRDIDLFDYEF